MKTQAKRKEVLDFIRSYFLEHGYAPSVVEIKEGCRLKSTSSVHNQMQWLYREGMIQTDAIEGSARAFRVTGMRVVDEGK